MNTMTTTRHQPTGSRRREVAAGIRSVAARFGQDLPALGTPGHLRDAARSLEHGNPESAKRHLRAAMNTLQPASLYRHGVLDDEGHTQARQHLTEIHRRLLQATEIGETEQDNARKAAMNAPDRVSAGPPDGAAAGPASPQPRGSMQFSSTVELVGPKGYVHGWHFVGVPGSPAGYKSLLAHPGLAGLDPMDRAVVSTHLSRAMSAAAAGDHTTAEFNLRDAELRAENRGAGSLVSAISLTRQYHHKQATSFLPGRNPMTPVQYHRLLISPRYPVAPARDPGPYLSGWQPSAIELGQIYAIAAELSAQTGALASTHRPFGSPSGPGLWGVKGMQLPAYVQNIARALLRTGRAKTLSQAIAMAKAATSRWLRGKNTSPEVRTASAKTDAEWDAERARARAS